MHFRFHVKQFILGIIDHAMWFHLVGDKSMLTQLKVRHYHRMCERVSKQLLTVSEWQNCICTRNPKKNVLTHEDVCSDLFSGRFALVLLSPSRHVSVLSRFPPFSPSTSSSFSLSVHRFPPLCLYYFSRLSLWWKKYISYLSSSK